MMRRKGGCKKRLSREMDVSGFSRIYTIASRECFGRRAYPLSLPYRDEYLGYPSDFNFSDEFVDFSLQKVMTLKLMTFKRFRVHHFRI